MVKQIGNIHFLLLKGIGVSSETKHDISNKGSETGSLPYFLHTGMKCTVYHTYLQLTNITAVLWVSKQGFIHMWFWLKKILLIDI